MALELLVWRIDSGLTRIQPVMMDLESRLEDILARDVSVAASNWMVIGRQVPTPWGKRIDLLCIDSDGNLVVLELKRDKTEREVVAQVLDYGSFVRGISAEEVPRLFNTYQRDYFPGQPAKSLEEAFCARFGVKQMPEELNSAHELVIVASTLDAATERIVEYLAEVSELNINAVFFRVFQDEGREYLTRVWLRDPETDEDTGGGTVGPHEKGEWNNEYYVNFGQWEARDWEDGIKYSFIAAGGAQRFRDAMERLSPGDRVWVNVPGNGFVGVGIVEEPAVPVTDFMVTSATGERVPILSVSLKAKNMGAHAEDPTTTEYLVRVKWIKTVPLSKAVRERGFFGNQNCVVQPKDAKWPYTIERLKQHFGIPG